MARTRHGVDREHKVEEIVSVARQQLLAGGFSELSMAAVARELGVAQNAVYWYFPSRDHLFVAVLRQMMADVAALKPPTSHDMFDRAVWFVDRVAPVHPLLVAMRDRARVSDVVAEFEREIDAVVRGMIQRALGDAVPAGEMQVAVESFLATIEGALLRQLSRRDRADVVTYALARLSGASWTPRRPGGRRTGRRS